MSEELARLGFVVDTGGLRAGMSGMDRYAATGRRMESGVAGNVSRVNSSFMTLRNTIGLASAALVAMGSKQIASEVIQYSDAWSGLNSQIRQVTDSESELLSVRKQLMSVSRDTRSDLANTVGLYTEMFRGTSNLAIAQSDLIGITKTVNNLFLAGGKSIAETSGAVRQLNQAFASGVLRGDEFNSVAEGAPKIMDALTQKLRITRGELRELAATGGITAGILADALLDYSDEAQALADKTETTFAQMSVLSSTNIMEFVGNSEILKSAVSSLGQAMLTLSENMGPLADAATASAVVVGGVLTLALLKASAATIKQTIATGAAINASRAAGIARATQAQGYAASASVMAASEVELSLSRVNGIKHTAAALVAELELEVVRMRSQISTQGRIMSASRMAEIQTARLGITRSLTVAEAGLATATTAAARAETARAAATTATAAASSIATASTTALGAAIRFMMGPWGLLITTLGVAAGMFLTSKGSADQLTLSLHQQSQAVQELVQSYKKGNTEALRSSLLDANQQKLDLLYEEVDLNKRLSMLEGDNSRSGTKKRRQASIELDAVNEKLSINQQKLSTIKDAYDQLFDDFVGEIKWVDEDSPSKDFIKWKSEIESFQTPLQKLNAEIAKIQSGLKSGTLTETSGLIAYLDKLQASREKMTKVEFGKTEGDADYSSWIAGIESSTGALEGLKLEIDDVWEAMDSGELEWDAGIEFIDKLENRIKDLKSTVEDMDLFQSVTDSIGVSLQAMQTMSGQGSKEYQKLGIAIQAVNAIQAIGAVINQATGDPYTAFVRMAAMAGAMAALGQSVGGLSSGSGQTSEKMQATQGLNEWGESATSINDAMDITAKASEDLVSINTDMLSALISLQSNINSAVGISISDAGTKDLSYDAGIVGNVYEELGIGTALDDFSTALFGDTLGGLLAAITNAVPNFIGDFLGGSSKITDSGVNIDAGTIAEQISNANVNAYQITESKKYAWSSSKTKETTAELSDASDQFSLIFASMADSVYAAGTALGMSGDSLEDSINEFNVASTTISLKGLSTSDQEEAISSVFSKIFNNLALSVVPFVSDFQSTGEELAETLVRLATEVAVANVLIDDLGMSFGSISDDPEMFVQAADNISSIIGGVDAFSGAVSSFIDDFASDEIRLSMLAGSVSDSLSSVGLHLPLSADGFYELTTSINASTSAGQEQIATLLSITDTASEYYDMLSETEESMASLSDLFAGFAMGLYDVSDSVAQVSLDAALANARLGDFDLAEALDLGAYSLDQGGFSSLSEYNIAQAEAANKILEISKLAASEAGDVETQQLDQLKAINKSIVDAARESQELLESQNRLNAETSETLDKMYNIGTLTRDS